MKTNLLVLGLVLLVGCAAPEVNNNSISTVAPLADSSAESDLVEKVDEMRGTKIYMSKSVMEFVFSSSNDVSFGVSVGVYSNGSVTLRGLINTKLKNPVIMPNLFSIKCGSSEIKTTKISGSDSLKRDSKISCGSANCQTNDKIFIEIPRDFFSDVASCSSVLFLEVSGAKGLARTKINLGDENAKKYMSGLRSILKKYDELISGDKKIKN